MRGYELPSSVSMGQNFTPYDAEHILEHEFAHLFQRGEEIAGVDDVLANMSLKSGLDFILNNLKKNNPLRKKITDVGYSTTTKQGFSDNFAAKDYWLTGADRGQEKAAFAAEVRENLLQRGLLKNRYDEITPELLEKHHELYNKTSGDKYRLRLYDIMKKDKKNYEILSSVLNKMPVVIPAAIGTGAAAAMVGSDTPQYKQGGWLNKYQDGGDISVPDLRKVKIKKAPSWKKP
jgi:hypothetical protein